MQQPAAPATSATYLAIDLGARRLAAAVVDDRGAVLVRDRVATPPRHVWPALTRLVSRVIAAAPGDARPVACGVACPGPIDHVNGGTLSVHLPGWAGFPLQHELEQATDLPVSLESTGRALALAEAWCGHAVGLADFVALLVGDTVDAGIVANGRLLGGRTGNVGQVGHLIVEPGGLRCACGGLGCLDAYASAGAIEADTNRPLRRCPAAIVERTGIMIARAIASVVAMIDTTRVFLTGSVPGVFGRPLNEAIDRELEQRSRLLHLAGLTVTTIAAAGPLVGAAAAARAGTL